MHTLPHPEGNLTYNIILVKTKQNKINKLFKGNAVIMTDLSYCHINFNNKVNK